MKKEADGKAHLAMPCPFCDRPASVKLCKPTQGKETVYFWLCECKARGFFPERHFKALDRAKKISLN